MSDIQIHWKKTKALTKFKFILNEFVLTASRRMAALEPNMNHSEEGGEGEVVRDQPRQKYLSPG